MPIPQLTVQMAKQGCGHDEVRKTLTTLSQVIGAVKINPQFPRLLDRENYKCMRTAAILLTAAIMDCLGSLITAINQSSTSTSDANINIKAVAQIFNAPDIEKPKNEVYRHLEAYSAARDSVTLSLQAEASLNKETEDILEWAWPESKPYTAALRSCDLVEGAGEWFLRSPEYTDWVGQGPPTLICPGHGNTPILVQVNPHVSRGREILSCVHIPSPADCLIDQVNCLQQPQMHPSAGTPLLLFQPSEQRSES